MRVCLIGYWRDDRSPDGDRLPDPRDLIDESWSEQERGFIASYLEHGFVARQYMGLSECRLCGMVNGFAEFTDGVYLWPEGLAHYVREHSVRLPDEVVAHIRRHWEEIAALDVDRDWWQHATST